MVRTSKFRIGGYQPGQKPDGVKTHQVGRFEAGNLPPKVDLRRYMTEVETQVGNSCVANAFVGAYEYLAKRDIGDAADVSRLFVYYNARYLGGNHGEDGGTQMYRAIESLVEYGACAEDIWPNDEELIFTEPDGSSYDHAANFKITEAEFIETDLDLWRHTLAEGYPIAFALNTFESFDEATRNRGRVPIPKRSDNVRETHGWHAMLCVGYSDRDRMFIVRNSWGSEWGDRGYCYIPYDYVIHPEYNGHDSWIIKNIDDVDFSVEVWEEEGSFFDEEGALLIYEFFITTTEPEGFVEALDELCQNHVEAEEDYYFDYEYEESEGDAYQVDILNFDLITEDPDAFLDALEALCLEYAEEEDYGFQVGDGETGDDEDDEGGDEDGEEYEGDDEEENGEDDEESLEEEEDYEEEDYEEEDYEGEDGEEE